MKSAAPAALFIACEGLIAGKPAPSGFAVKAKFVNTTDHCGSGLARERAVSNSANPLPATTSSHTFAVNLSLTPLFKTLDRISRYFKAKFSALIR
jgi:hypothetical protein